MKKDTGQFIENGLGATKVMKLLRFVLDNVQGYLAIMQRTFGAVNCEVYRN